MARQVNSSSSSSEMSDASNATWNEQIRVRFCGHEIPADLLTSYTVLNPGRRFYRCPLRRHDDCKFLEWLDPELPQNFKNMMSRVVIKKQSAEAHLELMKQKEKMWESKAMSAEAELNEAERSLNHLRYTVEELSEVNSKMADRLEDVEHEKNAKALDQLRLNRSLVKYKWISKVLVGFVVVLLVMLMFTCRGSKARLAQQPYMLP